MPTHSTPLVSVVIPAYNHEAYVQQTIRSIIAQTYANIELLVLNDGSKDATFEKINEMKEECQRRFAITWFHSHANRGTCATLNALLEQAKGKYVYLIASDDLAKPQAIQCLLDIMEADDQCVLAVGDNEYIDNLGNRVFKNSNSELVYEDSEAKYRTFAAQISNNNVDRLLTDFFGNYGNLLQGNHVPNGYLMRKEALGATGGYSAEAPLEDYYMALQLAKRGKMHFVSEVLFSYRQHDANTASRKEHMKAMWRKTLYHEAKIVDSSDSSYIKQLFNEYLQSRNYLFSLKPLLAMYRICNCLHSGLYLEVFGKRLKLYGRNKI